MTRGTAAASAARFLALRDQPRAPRPRLTPERLAERERLRAYRAERRRLRAENRAAIGPPKMMVRRLRRLAENLETAAALILTERP